MTPVFFSTPLKLRKWFEKNHLSEKEVWVGYYKRDSGRKSITWSQSVDEALCFGWIDGIRRSLDEERYAIRFTPRRPKSIWSRVNIEKVKMLTARGFMKTQGLEAFERRDGKRSEGYSFEHKEIALPSAMEKEFRSNRKAWEFFSAQAPYYRKAAIHWIMSAKKEVTRIKRMLTLVRDSERSLRIAPMRRNAKQSG